MTYGDASKSAADQMPQMQAVGERKARLLRLEFESWVKRERKALDYPAAFKVDLRGNYMHGGVADYWMVFKAGWALCEVAAASK